MSCDKQHDPTARLVEAVTITSEVEYADEDIADADDNDDAEDVNARIAVKSQSTYFMSGDQGYDQTFQMRALYFGENFDFTGFNWNNYADTVKADKKYSKTLVFSKGTSLAKVKSIRPGSYVFFRTDDMEQMQITQIITGTKKLICLSNQDRDGTFDSSMPVRVTFSGIIPTTDTRITFEDTNEDQGFSISCKMKAGKKSQSLRLPTNAYNLTVSVSGKNYTALITPLTGKVAVAKFKFTPPTN